MSDIIFDGRVRATIEVVRGSPSLVILQVGRMRFTLLETHESPIAFARNAALDLARCAAAELNREVQA